MNERERFEKRFKDELFLGEYENGGGYSHTSTCNVYFGWQARANMVCEWTWEEDKKWWKHGCGGIHNGFSHGTYCDNCSGKIKEIR